MKRPKLSELRIDPKGTKRMRERAKTLLIITPRRSDVAAKRAYASVLHKRGFTQIEITKAPADIKAILKGKIYYFELKCTEQTKRYFGAATLTEWEAALRWPTRYRFVVAAKKRRGWAFEEYMRST